MSSGFSYSDITKARGNPGTGVGIPAWPSNLVYEDMNVSTGGVARNTNIGNTFTDVYNQTGSGLLLGFVLTLDSAFDEWEIRLIVDSNTVFDINTKDLENDNVYGYEKSHNGDPIVLGFSTKDKTIRWQSPLNTPMSYDTDIVLEVRYIKGGSKKFKAGFFSRTV